MPKNIPHSKPWITKEDIQAVNKTLTAGMIAQGAKVAEFENKVAEYLGAEGGVASASGTSALVLALQTLNIGKGHEVILPTYVCRNVLEAVLAVGAVPVICDVGPEWVMTPKEIEPHITPRTAAIIAVHIFGFPVDVAAIKEFNVLVIEDACHAFGLELEGGPAGTLGEISFFSFHATKCLTTGEGGMLVSNNREILARALSLRDGYLKVEKRIPSPMSDMQAALGLAQLGRYNAFINRRKKLKNKYTEAFQNIPSIELPANAPDFLFRFPLRNKTDMSIDHIQTQMAAYGIHIRKGVDSLIHRELNLQDNDFSNALLHFNQTFSLPYYPVLEIFESDYVVSSLLEVLN
jgi:UDP-4-amino-4-deoxy-L-arabinose-oxoglutarate aminotransferase